MVSNKVKVNDEEVVGSRSRTSVSGTWHLEISSRLISFQSKVKNPGVILDSRHTMRHHISFVCH